MILFDEAAVTSLVRLSAAALVGALIGLERSYHGRPAGFRTHTLVSAASTLLMLVTVYQVRLLPDLPLDTLRIDPTRMAQGVMTGIGFLGAGVIMKEGLSVRGLTTAASLWITAAIGILIGLGFMTPALIATALTLGTLSLFRWIESKIPGLSYGRLRVSFPRNQQPDRDEMRAICSNHCITTSNTSYLLRDSGRHFEYQMTIRSQDSRRFRELAETLTAMDTVLEFEIKPVGEK